MDFLPGLPLPLALAVLALIDGLSIGTLLIPLFLLLAPGRVRGGRVLLYLFTIAGFYLLVGALFLVGLVNVIDVASKFLSSPVGATLRLIVGLVLLLVAILMPTRDRAAEKARVRVAAGVGDAEATPAPPAVPGRLARWRERLLSDRASAATVMAVALAAGLVEVTTMLPYLVGMTMLADADIALPLQAGALAGYCLVMIAPALLLLVLRIVAARVVERPLQKLSDWLTRTAAENTAWIMGIIGFLIARAAAGELGIFEWLGGLGGAGGG